MPIALVITELDVGGAERALVNLASGLDRRRWAPSVIALGPEAPLAAPLRDAEVPVQCLGVDPRRPIHAVARLANRLRDVRPRIVQSFLFHANVASRLAAPLSGFPWVVGGLRVAEHARRWHLTLDRLTMPLASGSVCVSEGVARFSRTVGHLDPGRLVVIPNGIDPAPFDDARPIDRRSIGVPDGATLALFVGRLDPQKGLPDLLQAAGTVFDRRPDWHLALAGTGPERDRLHDLGAHLPPERLHWLGLRDNVPSLLKAADYLVLPSLWEGMPNVVLEAMAARRAVVATDVEGTVDLVLPEVNGWLVPPADPGALARALLDASSDPQRLRTFGQAARDRLDRHFHIDRVIASFERLWAAVLGLRLPDDSR